MNAGKWDSNKTIGAVLRQKAEKDNVEVKLILYYHPIAALNVGNAPGLKDARIWAKPGIDLIDGTWKYSTPDEYRQSWFANVVGGKSEIGDLQLIQAKGTKGEVSRQNYKETQRIRKALPGNYKLSFMLEWTFTQHQKMILIDHEDPKNATGFIQGFNLLPHYFDFKTHPYSSTERQDPDKSYQDVGVHVQGTAIYDLYHNFKESWNQKITGDATQLTTAEPDITALANNHRSASDIQILRTWPKKEEFTIDDFYQHALGLAFDHIYVEDQYFRSPELVEKIIERAKALKANGSAKAIYLFVITNLSSVIEETEIRAEIMERLGQKESKEISDDLEWLAFLDKDGKKSKDDITKLQNKMAAIGVMGAYGVLKTAKRTTKSVSGYEYRDITTHSKLCTINDQCYTVGSANWNIRSMRADTELNIAVSDAKQTREWRQELWGYHFNQTLPDSDDMDRLHKEWREKLHENDRRLAKEQAPLSRAFSYHQNLLEFFDVG
jgi:phosphatidylserine/phosphatidylglycerophosphate/cardiolipin synthase-like enzyme